MFLCISPPTYSYPFLFWNQVIRENWNLKYSACFVLCPVTAPDVTVPFAVSVVSKLRSPPGNVLLVRNTDEDVDLVNTTHITNIPDKIGICVKPFHFDYDSVSNRFQICQLAFYAGEILLWHIDKISPWEITGFLSSVRRHYICWSFWNWTQFLVQHILHFTITLLVRKRHVCSSTI